MLLLGAAVALSLCFTAPAPAITNGAPDEGRHPAVGALVTHDGRDRKKRLICSGTLVSPTVFLTAAHCVVGEPERLYVSFEPFVGAPDVAAEVTLHPGTVTRHPSFTDETAPGDTHDVAVVKLDPPVTHVGPAQLPYEGQFDAPPAGPLLVGYGREGYDGRSFFGGGSRRFATGSLASVEPFKLNLNQSGTLGGTCNGDSGGPLMLPDSVTVGAVTSDGDPYCQETGIYYRVDTASARAFLAPFVPLPERPADAPPPAPPGTPGNPSTTAPRLVAPGKVSTRFRRTSRGARIARLRVSGLDPKGGAALRCQGAHCPFRIRSIKGSSVADFTRRLARVRLRVGTQLRLELVAPGRAHRLLAWVVTRDGVQRIRR